MYPHSYLYNLQHRFGHWLTSSIIQIHNGLMIVTLKRLLILPPTTVQWKINSRAFDSEGAAKQTCPSLTIDSESECEEVNLKSCLDVHYEKRDGVHRVLVHDKKGEQKWTPVCG